MAEYRMEDWMEPLSDAYLRRDILEAPDNPPEDEPGHEEDRLEPNLVQKPSQTYLVLSPEDYDPESDKEDFYAMSVEHTISLPEKDTRYDSADKSSA